MICETTNMKLKQLVSESNKKNLFSQHDCLQLGTGLVSTLYVCKNIYNTLYMHWKDGFNSRQFSLKVWSVQLCFILEHCVPCFKLLKRLKFVFATSFDNSGVSNERLKEEKMKGHSVQEHTFIHHYYRSYEKFTKYIFI